MHLETRVHIECGEGLVQQQNVAMENPVLRQRHAPPHASGKLRGVVIREVNKSDAAKPGFRLFFGFGGGSVRPNEPRLDILENGFPRQQRFLLEQIGSAWVNSRQGFSEYGDLSRGGREQTGRNVQQCGFAASGWSHQRHEFARLDGEGELIQSPE